VILRVAQVNFARPGQICVQKAKAHEETEAEAEAEAKAEVEAEVLVALKVLQRLGEPYLMMER
jgi:hypothetical protein